jgi:hypothetical protein
MDAYDAYAGAEWAMLTNGVVFSLFCRIFTLLTPQHIPVSLVRGFARKWHPHFRLISAQKTGSNRVFSLLFSLLAGKID